MKNKIKNQLSDWFDTSTLLIKILFVFIIQSIVFVFSILTYPFYMIVFQIKNRDETVKKIVDKALMDHTKNKTNIQYLNDLLTWTKMHYPKRLEIINYIKTKLIDEN